ncbi:MAG: glycosyltransferase family 4 protein [Bryobacteraceae bacterium]|nr:glycosyltransferase family 4 protein [Bryobacteraceae bacterium]
MRIALDATPLSGLPGGIARYTAELSAALAREFPDDEYHLVSDQPSRSVQSAPPNLRHLRAANGYLQRRWWSLGLPLELRKLRAGIFHGTDFAVPYLPVCPTVLTLHDRSPWKDPAWRAGSDRVRRRTPALLQLGLATMIVTPSEAVRREAIQAFRLHSDRVVATPLAAAPKFQPVPLSAESPSAGSYFLYVGALEPRKNIPMLIDAWREVRRRHPVDLVLAGRPREDFPATAPEPGLRLLGEKPDEDLPRLYSHATAFLYPSLYEGFGLPVLEAMACGAAVLVSEDPALAELAGDAGVRIGGPAGEWAAAMTLALEQPDWLARRRAASLRRAREFSWPATARKTREVYEEARRRFGW